jgi:hypothetical protein
VSAVSERMLALFLLARQGLGDEYRIRGWGWRKPWGWNSGKFAAVSIQLGPAGDHDVELSGEAVYWGSAVPLWPGRWRVALSRG